MGSFVKECSFCGGAIEMSDRTGRYLPYEENGQRHFCKRGKRTI